MEDKKVLNEKELNAVTGGAAEEGLNGHLYAVPTSEVINDNPQIIGGLTATAPDPPAHTLGAGYEDVFDVPNPTKQYKYRSHSAALIV